VLETSVLLVGAFYSILELAFFLEIRLVWVRRIYGDTVSVSLFLSLLCVASLCCVVLFGESFSLVWLGLDHCE
jgi:hypothetical protein